MANILLTQITHIKNTGRFITGILAIIGSTPNIWKPRQQTALQTLIFGSKFTAIKTAVEEAITLHYHLMSRGVRVDK